MLGKLLKYDSKSLSKLIFPISLAAILATALGCGLIAFMNVTVANSANTNVIDVVLNMTCGMMIFFCVLALIAFGIAVQIVLFLAVSICLLVFTRKIFVEKLKAGSEKTNVDALVGEKGVVISPIHPYEVGQVKVGGQVWSAVGKNPDETFAVDQLVKINAIEGVKAEVNLEAKTASVSADGVDKEILKKAVEEAGYEVISIQ